MQPGRAGGKGVRFALARDGHDGSMANHKSWSDLTSAQQAGVGVLGVVQIGLLVAAQIDLTRRRDDQVNGPKALWRALTLINFVGPLAYFAVGRR